MEALEYTLILLACIIASSVLGRLVRHVALPLVQIAVGFVVALIAPDFVEVQISSELFLVLFIAPLLFDEARRSSRRQLWRNKGSILSLAVGMVFVTVLCVGFVLNLIVPSIPLAAAFACGAALAPTDAAAVGALGSSIGLRKRQEVLLSGESLVNDASGVVSFHFAIAAVVTGAFSAIDAAGEFGVMFFGGVGIGLAFGLVAYGSMRLLRRFGYEDTVIHVLYEVFTPFFVFLLAKWAGVSGILAVVAAGLVMSERTPRMTSIDAARRQMVSDNFWKVIVFLINGIIFVMLGTQLPLALAPAVSDVFSVPGLIGIILVITLLMMACRFLWLTVMELFHKDEGNGKRGFDDPRKALKDALTMTLAGPKGAVTLSIIFTIPLYVTDGSVFPQRSLIIFLTAGVILATLLLANFLLPLLAPKRKESNEEALHEATLKVLETTINELHKRLNDGEADEYVPALRLTEARYQTRLARERENALECGKCIAGLSQDVLSAQQARADELKASLGKGLSAAEEIPYFLDLRSIRGSVGYVGSAIAVGSRPRSISEKVRMLAASRKPLAINDEKSALAYLDSCLFAIELERVAIDYLNKVAAEDPKRSHAAKVMADTHAAALNSIRGRISYGQEGEDALKEADLELRLHDRLPDGMRLTFSDQISKARRYADEVDANALIIELDCIRHMQESGEISESVAHQLRRRVYALQGALEGY